MIDQQRMDFFLTADCRGLSDEELQLTVVRLLKESRVAHVLGCAQTGVRLAQIWGESTRDAYRAGLLHDITKALDGAAQLELCQGLHISIDPFARENPKTLHAVTGAVVAERVFGENEAVVRAIDSHTTGCAGMNTLQKIIYVADYMEPNRDFEGVEQLRRLAETDLDAAVRMGIEMTICVLQQQGKTVCPRSLQALESLKN